MENYKDLLQNNEVVLIVLFAFFLGVAFAMAIANLIISIANKKT